MIEIKDLIEIGKFQKTHALKGELNAILEIDPSFLENGNAMIIEDDGILVPYFVDSVRGKGKTSYLIKIKGIEDENTAKEFVNKNIYAIKAEASEYFEYENEEELISENELAGYEICDAKGNRIGEIDYIDSSTANVLFVVKDNEDEKIFIPAIDEFIIELDKNNKIIKMELPEGLLDLNSKNKKNETEF